jgi:hypothetical protein
MRPLFTKILVNQFTRLSVGDRFFYLNEQWSPEELKLLQQGDTLAKVIEANTGVTNLQGDVAGAAGKEAPGTRARSASQGPRSIPTLKKGRIGTERH